MAEPEELHEQLLTVRDWLRYAVSHFNAAGLVYGHGTATALDEAAYLVLHTLHLPMDQLEPWLDARLLPAERKALQQIVEKRVSTRKPAPYLTNEAWVGGHAFYVDERVIVPRSYIGELLAGGLAGALPEPAEVRQAWTCAPGPAAGGDPCGAGIRACESRRDRDFARGSCRRRAQRAHLWADGPHCPDPCRPVRGACAWPLRADPGQPSLCQRREPRRLSAGACGRAGPRPCRGPRRPRHRAPHPGPGRRSAGAQRHAGDGSRHWPCHSRKGLPHPSVSMAGHGRERGRGIRTRRGKLARGARR